MNETYRRLVTPGLVPRYHQLMGTLVNRGAVELVANVFDRKYDAIDIVNDLDARCAAILHGIVDQVCDGATYKRRSAGNVDAALAGIGNTAAGIFGVFANIPNENAEIDQRPRLLARLIARWSGVAEENR